MMNRLRSPLSFLRAPKCVHHWHNVIPIGDDKPCNLVLAGRRVLARYCCQCGNVTEANR